MHILKIISFLQAGASLTTSEPIPNAPKGGLLAQPQANLILLPRAQTAPNWTTQAWQTHCDNIDYFGDNNECCTHLSGGTWKNCNGVGWSTISESGVLCYDLTAGHDCCDDDSVCDTGLGCSAGACSQTDTSVTVCRDGCVSYKGYGCSEGTCAHGRNTVVPSASVGEDTPTSTGGLGATSTSLGTTGPEETSTAGKADKGGGGLSTSDKIAIGIGVPVGIFTIIGAVVTWVMCRRG